MLNIQYKFKIFYIVWLHHSYIGFSLLWQNTREKLFKRGKFYFGSQFQRLQFVVCWLCCFWDAGEAGTLGQRVRQRKQLAWQQPESREQEDYADGLPPPSAFVSPHSLSLLDCVPHIQGCPRLRCPMSQSSHSQKHPEVALLIPWA